MKFSVDVKTSKGDVNLGVVPGVFDAKELVLSVLGILIHNADGKYVRLVRTLDKNELGKCDFFITDGFQKNFPHIKSYNNVKQVWNEYAKDIIIGLYGNLVDYDLVKKYAVSNISKFANFDVLTNYNSYFLNLRETFQTAVEKAGELLLAIIDAAVIKSRSFNTLRYYLDGFKGDILYFPLNINYKGNDEIKNVKWVIVKEDEEIYRVDNLNKDLDLRQCINNKLDVIYAGRFFAKVTSYDLAIGLINYIEESVIN